MAALDVNLKLAVDLYRLLVIQVFTKCRLCLQTFLYFLSSYLKVPTNRYLFPETDLLCSVHSNSLVALRIYGASFVPWLRHLLCNLGSVS